MKQLTFAIAVLLGFVTFAPVFAQTGAGVDANAAVNAAGTSVGASATVSLTASETKLRTRGDAEVDRRVAALNQLSARVTAMQKISDQFKTALNQSVQAQVTALTALKAKIDADTDSSTLKVDLKSITDGYRIFALVLPQGRIAAAADKVVTISSMMNTMGAKLQARIQTAGAAGADVTALTTALNDLGAKLTDAQTQAQAAVTVSAALQPDNGDKTAMASNAAALKTAKTDLQTATKDLQAARKDIETIIKGLAKVESTTSASSTTQVQTQ